MKVLFFTRYSSLGASSRYRTYQYIPFLEEMGATCHISPLLSDSYLESLYNKNKFGVFKTLGLLVKRFFKLFSVKQYDLVVIEKELFPFLPSVFEFMLFILKIPFIVDYDDAIFHNYDMHKSVFIRVLLGNKIKKIMGWASAVMAGNSYLADYAKRSNDHVVEIPTVINLQKYTLNDSQKRGPFTIGWMGSPTTSCYIRGILPALEQFSKDFPCLLKLVGFDEEILPPSITIPLKIVPWSEEDEIAQIQSFHVGVMPLDDSPWSQGKCGFKLIQYMACKLPVIASPVGANLKIIDNNVNGFLASDQEEWYQALSTFYTDRKLGEKMGETNRQKVEKVYSLQVTSQTYFQVLQSNLLLSRRSNS